MRRSRGFTLLELLVATSVLVILGSALVVVLRGGIATWRRGEARRESFEVAQAVLGQLADDLQCATIDPVSGHGVVEAMFRGDQDDGGRSRIALVRTLRGESENPITGHAGSQLGADARIGYRNDLEHASERRIRATGGLTEVAWVMGPPGGATRNVLFRGIRSPVGGAMSFFKFELAADRKSVLYHFFPAPLAGEPAAKNEPPDGASYCREFARDVVYFEVLYATPYTNTWETDALPVRSLRDRSGPLAYWDSTRGVLQPPASHAKDQYFKTWKGTASQDDPADDVLPTRVKVTIVVREAPAAESSTPLRGDVTRTSAELIVYDPARLDANGGFVRVDDEWIQYESVSSGRAKVKQRGVRGTAPAAHTDGAEVIIGRTFEAVIALPAAREDWGDK